MSLPATLHSMRAASTEPDRRSQLLRGLLDMCLLSLLATEPAYGYEVTRRLADHGLEASDGSVYPLLGRLQRQRLIESFAVASESGPPRKYYRTTAAGQDRLRSWTEHWRGTAKAVEALLGTTTGPSATDHSTSDEENTWTP
jgi:PadR family transcriptional regulator PadR